MLRHVNFIVNNMAKYPTKKEILYEEQRFKPETIKTMKEWKKDWLINHDDKSVYRLLTMLSQIYDKPLCITNVNTNSYYNPATRTINLHNTSIITALHEFAHHLYGPSEYKACKWSVWLFKKTFKTAYSKLTWSGHTLINK